MSQPGGEGGRRGLDYLGSLDDGREERFSELARDLLNNLFILIRSAGMHALNNAALDRPRRLLSETVKSFIDLYHEEVALQLVDENFFVNKRILSMDAGTFENARFLTRIFDFLDVNEIAFTRHLDVQTLDDFLRAFLQVVRHREGLIQDYDLGSIRARKRVIMASRQAQLADDRREHILGVYASGMLTMRAFVNDLRRGKTPRHTRIKRLCLDLIDVEPRHHNLLLSLLHLEAYKGNLFCHMLNTAVLSIVFGHRLGLTRDQLVDLGMAAFHKDLGWALLGALDTEIGTEIRELSLDGVDYSSRASTDELDALRIKVARTLVRLGGFNESVINRLIVAYECQVSEEESGQNLYYGDVGPSFMTQVVRMASTYDALTTDRPGHPALPSDQAMRRILDDGGRTFDVFMAKIFANCLGAYPVGTVVEMDTGEVGLVVNLPSNPVNFHRPQCKLLVDKTGAALRDGEVVDLDDTYRGGRRYVRTIERTLDAAQHGLSATRFFFG